MTMTAIERAVWTAHDCLADSLANERIGAKVAEVGATASELRAAAAAVTFVEGVEFGHVRMRHKSRNVQARLLVAARILDTNAPAGAQMELF